MQQNNKNNHKEKRVYSPRMFSVSFFRDCVNHVHHVHYLRCQITQYYPDSERDFLNDYSNKPHTHTHTDLIRVVCLPLNYSAPKKISCLLRLPAHIVYKHTPYKYLSDR